MGGLTSACLNSEAKLNTILNKGVGGGCDKLGVGGESGTCLERASYTCPFRARELDLGLNRNLLIVVHVLEHACTRVSVFETESERN